ncbi:uncharacterized protein [Apostichopus japonicus]|uniref:uncharacterized protein isoform X2 n=1 Tax=Stichopus japonicus TaxID=307972 RepID=UPI003AB5C5CF
MNLKENLIYFVLLVATIPFANNSTVLIVIPKGGIISLECKLISKLDTLVWNRNGHILASYSDNSLRDYNISVEIDTDRSASYLSKRSADLQDAGNYSCIQHHQQQHMVASNTTFQIFIQGYPKLSVNTSTTRAGETILASCCADVRPPYLEEVDFTWSIGDVPLLGYFTNFSNVMNFTVSRHCGIATVRNITSYMDGTKLRCLTDKAAGHFASVTLNVEYQPVVKIKSIAGWQVVSGQHVDIVCEVQSNPLAEVYLQVKTDTDWTTVEIQEQQRNNSEDIYFMIIISNTSFGYYRCLAQNSHGFSFSKKKLLSQDKRTQYVTAVVIPCTALVLLLLACLTYKLRKSVQVQIQHPLSIRFTSDYIHRLSSSLPSRQYLPRTAKSSNTNRNLEDTRNNTEQAGACSSSVREETSTVRLSSTKVSHCCKSDEGYDVVVQSVPVTPNQYAYSHLERGFINKGEYELHQQ